jgi:hypothetical protein
MTTKKPKPKVIVNYQWLRYIIRVVKDEPRLKEEDLVELTYVGDRTNKLVTEALEYQSEKTRGQSRKELTIREYNKLQRAIKERQEQ